MQIEITPVKRPETKISHAALLVAVGGAFSLLAGLASQVVSAYFFGAGAEMDAFFTALTIPLYLQIVLLGGLPFVVIPAFVNEQSSGDENDAWSLIGTFIWITIAVLAIVTLIGVLFSYQIIVISAPGFGQEKTLLASQMLAVMMFSVPFMGLATFTSGVENVRERFFWPAAATAVGSLGNLATLVLLYSSIGPMALAWGNLVSAVLQASITTIPVLMHGWKKTMGFNDPRLREMLRLIAPFIIFGMITSSRLLFERYFASALPNGQLSYFGYANKISNIFVILFATSVASAIFPAMARSFSQEGISGLLKQTSYGFRLTFALAFPALLILSVAAYPLVKTFYERGAFIEPTTIGVSILIPIAMFNDLFLRMINNMVGRTFFVLKDTFTTNLVTSLTLVLYVVLAKILTEKFGFIGLAIAQPIQFGVAQAIMLFLLGRKIKFTIFKPVLRSTFIYLLISSMAAIVAWIVLQLLRSFPSFIQLAFSLPISSLVYLVLLFAVDREIGFAVMEMTGLTKILSKNRSRSFLKKFIRLPKTGS
ncbi:MAG: murein biosynthesis integral membrane protein MurJ [Anaerolineaceae bacterium]